MRMIALMNQKGGVGKTTTTVNLGAALAERGRRVLLVDLDPQAHLTITYGVEQADGPTLYEVLTGDAGVLECVRRLEITGVAGELHVLPGSLDLAGVESEMAGIDGRQLRLREAMAKLSDTYDYVLLDCPPSLGLLTINALALADEVLIPMQAHFLALQGFAKLLETTQLVCQSMNPALKVSGVVLTMFDAQTRLSNDVVNELQGFFDAARGQYLPWSEAVLFASRIRRNIKLAEAPSFGQSILAYDAQSRGAADYRALAEELEGAIAPEAASEVAIAHAASSNEVATLDVEPPGNPSAEEVHAEQELGGSENVEAAAVLAPSPAGRGSSPSEARRGGEGGGQPDEIDAPIDVEVVTATKTRSEGTAENVDPVPDLTPQEQEALRPELEFVRRIPIHQPDDSLENEPVEVLR